MGTRMHHSLHLRYHYHEVQIPPHLDSAWRFFYFEDWWNTKDAWTQILFFSFEDYGRTRMHEPSWTHILFPLKLGRMEGICKSLFNLGHHHHQHWGSRSLLPQKALAWQPLAANEADGQLWRTRSSSAGLSTLLFCAPRLGHMQGLAGWV